jgi:hypothetical protein
MNMNRRAGNDFIKIRNGDNRVSMLQRHRDQMQLNAVKHLKNKRMARSQPGELSASFLRKRGDLQNSSIDALDIKIKKKKIQNPHSKQSKILTFPQNQQRQHQM